MLILIIRMLNNGHFIEQCERIIFILIVFVTVSEQVFDNIGNQPPSIGENHPGNVNI